MSARRRRLCGVVRRALPLCLAAAFQAAAVARPDDSALFVWTLARGQLEAPLGVPPGPLPVGSLQKPFVAQAWAVSHPGQQPPRRSCPGGRACWFPAGHGRCDLRRALAFSCNFYFLELARATPPEQLAASLQAGGFVLSGPLAPEAAIGLDAGAVRIAPAALLEAYARLAARPWPAGEAVRGQVLLGLHDAARVGTASALGLRVAWAKTGTVPALDGGRLQTSGWVVALEGPDRGRLALLLHGTGRESARALARRALQSESPSRQEAALRAELPGRVSVRLFEQLDTRAARARNLGPTPVQVGGTSLAPGAELELRPGTRLGPAHWELRLPAHGLVRRLAAAIEARAGTRPVLVAEMEAREYMGGVLAGELPEVHGPERTELAAVLLRWLRGGPRHADAQVCDSTHCAFFAGRGPRVSWPDGRRARILPELLPAPLSEALWQSVLARARQPGPVYFTGHCGGRPLSEYQVWGRGSDRRAPCARHSTPAAPWRRRWPRGVLARAFGIDAQQVQVQAAGTGPWRLLIDDTRGSRRTWSYDAAHRRLASWLGWDALPSPAEGVSLTGAEVEAWGYGRGHRVGLCLAGLSP